MINQIKALKESSEEKKAEYRSAKRSRQMIRDAFIELLQKKSPEKITVTDIVHAADINRSTFYSHYKSPHDVLVQIAEEVIDEINLVLGDFNFVSFVQNSTPILTRFCEYLMENREIHQKLISLQGVNSFMQKICDILNDFICNDSSVPPELKSDENFNIAISFFVNAIVYSFRDFIAGSLGSSYEQLVSMINYLISQNFPAMLEYLDNKKDASPDGIGAVAN